MITKKLHYYIFKIIPQPFANMVITGYLCGNMLSITKGTKYSIIYQYVKRPKSDRRHSLINESTKRPPIGLGIEHKKFTTNDSIDRFLQHSNEYFRTDQLNNKFGN